MVHEYVIILHILLTDLDYTHLSYGDVVFDSVGIWFKEVYRSVFLPERKKQGSAVSF